MNGTFEEKSLGRVEKSVLDLSTSNRIISADSNDLLDSIAATVIGIGICP